MVRAVIAGVKTQTRRTMSERHRWHFIEAEGDPGLCPYGVPGDRLWVREAFSGHHDWEGQPPSDWRGVENDPIWYWADGNPQRGDWTKPKPSIHMPRRFSRITLEVTGVRVERLQDISEADAKAEGCVLQPARHCYEVLWEQINGPGSWAANPWVWAVEFRRV